MRHLFLVLVLLYISVSAFAQEELFGKEVHKDSSKARKGWVISLNGDVDQPAADMAKRFGTSFRVGPSVLYKTMSNWMFGVKGDFIFGNKIKEDSLMANIKDSYGEFLSKDGYRIGVPVHERGYAIGLQAGKIINLGGKIKDNGLLLLTSVGYIQHKINIFDKDHDVEQLRGDYLKGYDRLTNGAFVEEYIAYNYFSLDGLLNFHIGIDALVGFTQGERTWLFDVRRPGTDKRTDILFGIRGGWDIPIFKHKSEELYFE